jgi:hypothetical protein
MIIIKLQAQADSWARERMHNNEIFCTWERADKTVTLQEQNIKEHKATSQGRACNNEIFCTRTWGKGRQT